MSKNPKELTFKEKFRDKIETMGKDGIMGVRKNSENVNASINYHFNDEQYNFTKSKIMY